jgi:16S rRNA (guanine1207-N2)-methyltransferase
MLGNLVVSFNLRLAAGLRWCGTLGEPLKWRSDVSQSDQVIRLVSANSPGHADRLVAVDAPELVLAAASFGGGPEAGVVAWCDDRRADLLVPDEFKPVDDDGSRLLDATVLDGADLVWMRLPRSLTGLDEYASLVSRFAAPGVTLVAFGRNQDLNRSMNGVLGRHFAEVHASLGVGKFRALVASGPKPAPGAPSWPRSRRHDDLELAVWAHGETFATTRIDSGTRLLIDHLGQVPGGDVLDFGSGSGVVGTLLGRRNPSAQITAIDVSRWAVDSTRRTATGAHVGVDALWADGTAGLPDHSLDVIVTNPPFHRGAAKESEATLALIREAPRILRPGGEVWMVFNSHLPWRTRLAQAVGPTTQIAQDPHYTVVRSTLRAA